MSDLAFSELGHSDNETKIGDVLDRTANKPERAVRIYMNPGVTRSLDMSILGEEFGVIDAG